MVLPEFEIETYHHHSPNNLLVLVVLFRYCRTNSATFAYESFYLDH